MLLSVFTFNGTWTYIFNSCFNCYAVDKTASEPLGYVDYLIPRQIFVYIVSTYRLMQSNIMEMIVKVLKSLFKL